MTSEEQILLVLVGIPGSGKSTLAQLFRQQGWTIISQDELGDRKACEAACSRALRAGHCVVIDRCNHNMQQRSHWLDIARRLHQGMQGQQPWPWRIRAVALCLELPAEVCVQRASTRTAHATLSPGMAREVVNRFLSEWQAPSQREGFHQVRVARSSEEAAAAAAELLRGSAAPPAAPAAGVANPAECVESAVPPRPQFAGQPAAEAQLSAGAAAFRPGVPWQAAAQQASMQQQAQQGWQPPAAGWHQYGQPTQQAWQQQQQQQHRGYRSRADAASSWRAGAGGAKGAAQDVPQRSRSPVPQRGRSAAEPNPGEVPAGSNIVPFPGSQDRREQREQRGEQPADLALGHPRHLPRRHPWQRYSHDQPSGFVLDAGVDASRPILMFDANGTVTSHTSMRRSSGLHKARPGIHHLRRLQKHFHIGIYSSASHKTINTALELLESAAGPGGGPLFNRRLVLHRSHTFLAPLAHVEAGGKEWDTVKPLRPYFSRLHRVILVDDDSFKACVGEESNMLVMPCWRGDDPADNMVRHLVDVLLQLAEALEGDAEADVRDFTADASAQLAALASEAAATAQQGQEDAAEAALGSAAAAAWEEEQEREAAAEQELERA